jgi:hypothetical protein
LYHPHQCAPPGQEHEGRLYHPHQCAPPGQGHEGRLSHPSVALLSARHLTVPNDG